MGLQVQLGGPWGTLGVQGSPSGAGSGLGMVLLEGCLERLGLGTESSSAWEGLGAAGCQWRCQRAGLAGVSSQKA